MSLWNMSEDSVFVKLIFCNPTVVVILCKYNTHGLKMHMQIAYFLQIIKEYICREEIKRNLISVT